MENEKLKEQKIKKTTGEVQDNLTKRGRSLWGTSSLSMKGGGYLLSRIALQYHRRKRA